MLENIEEQWRMVVRSYQLRRALWALGELGISSPAEIARCINGRTSYHWAGPGCGRFFRLHFTKGSSPFFKRTDSFLNARSRYKYELTPLGEKLLERMRRDLVGWHKAKKRKKR